MRMAEAAATRGGQMPPPPGGNVSQVFHQSTYLFPAFIELSLTWPKVTKIP